MSHAHDIGMSMKETIVRQTADACAAGIGVACIVEWLPPIAALLSIIWLSLQIVDFCYRRLKK